MKGIGILIVVYEETATHSKLIKDSIESFRSKDTIELLSIINKCSPDLLDFVCERGEVKLNRKNSLASAWNLGLQHLFSLGYKKVLVPNLDILYRNNSIDNLYSASLRYPDAGIWSMTACNTVADFITKQEVDSATPIINHDQSFSSFLISEELYNKVGEFDEGFTPAYYEDVDYLRRCHIEGYTPQRILSSIFYHITQGTVKYGSNTKTSYNQSLMMNRDFYISKWGGDIGAEKYTIPFNKQKNGKAYNS